MPTEVVRLKQPASVEPLRRHSIPGLDGVRGIAIILVMLFHLVAMKPAAKIDHAFFELTRFGWSGVNLFFVLSGFLITGILIDARGSEHYFRNFYARRALRILPLYYAFVAGLLFLYPRVGGPNIAREAAVLERNQIWVWTHAVSWLVAGTGDFWARTPLGTGGFWSPLYRGAVLSCLASHRPYSPATPPTPVVYWPCVCRSRCPLSNGAIWRIMGSHFLCDLRAHGRNWDGRNNCGAGTHLRWIVRCETLRAFYCCRGLGRPRHDRDYTARHFSQARTQARPGPSVYIFRVALGRAGAPYFNDVTRDHSTARYVYPDSSLRSGNTATRCTFFTAT
jgi:hypothetical protein